MLSFVKFLCAGLAVAFVFPEQTLALIRRAKRWLRDDVRRRVTAEQWEDIKHEFADVRP